MQLRHHWKCKGSLPGSAQGEHILRFWRPFNLTLGPFLLHFDDFFRDPIIEANTNLLLTKKSLTPTLTYSLLRRVTLSRGLSAEDPPGAAVDLFKFMQRYHHQYLKTKTEWQIFNVS